MFDARRAIVSLALIASAPHAGAAQDMNKLGARLLAADRLYIAAHDSIQVLAKAERDRGIPYDSIVAGSLTLRYWAKEVPPSTRTLLARAAANTWAQMQHALGNGADRVARRLPIVVSERAWLNGLAPHIIEFHLAGAAGRGRAFTTPMSEAQAEDVIVDLNGASSSVIMRGSGENATTCTLVLL